MWQKVFINDWGEIQQTKIQNTTWRNKTSTIRPAGVPSIKSSSRSRTNFVYYTCQNIQDVFGGWTRVGSADEKTPKFHKPRVKIIFLCLFQRHLQQLRSLCWNTGIKNIPSLEGSCRPLPFWTKGDIPMSLSYCYNGENNQSPGGPPGSLEQNAALSWLY